MKKKIVVVLMAMMLVLGLAACGANETEEAKKTFDGFMGAVKNLDNEKLKEYVSKKDVEKFEKGQKVDKESEEYKNAKPLLDVMDGKYVSGEVEKDATTATMKYKITSPDMSNLMGEMMKKAASGDPKDVKIDPKDVKSVEREIDVKFIKEDGKWKVNEAQKLFLEMMGLGSLSNMVK